MASAVVEAVPAADDGGVLAAADVCGVAAVAVCSEEGGGGGGGEGQELLARCSKTCVVEMVTWSPSLSLEV